MHLRQLRAKSVFLGTVMCLLLGRFSPAGAENLNPPRTVIPAAFFGNHIHHASTTTPWPSVPFGSWRLWDAYTAWPNLEPKQAVWRFEELDKLIRLAEAHKVEVLLPLGLSPEWASARPGEKSTYSPGNAAEPRNMELWKTYVRTVALKYKGRVHYYEIWNEPNLKGFYSGSTAQLVSLAGEAYRILKQVDPSCTVVSPAGTGTGGGPVWLDEYLASGGGAYCDVIGYHFYVTPSAPEAMLALINSVKSVMAKHHVAKPLWNTEAGWQNNKKFDNDDEGAAYLARSYVINWAAGVERFYWYAWDDLGISIKMIKDKNSYLPTSAAKAYGEMEKWLVGTRMTSCSSDSNGTWTCKLTRDGGQAAWIIWNVDRTLRFAVPGTWGVRRMGDLKGVKHGLTGASEVNIGPAPILLEM